MGKLQHSHWIYILIIYWGIIYCSDYISMNAVFLSKLSSTWRVLWLFVQCILLSKDQKGNAPFNNAHSCGQAASDECFHLSPPINNMRMSKRMDSFWVQRLWFHQFFSKCLPVKFIFINNRTCVSESISEAIGTVEKMLKDGLLRLVYRLCFLAR